MKTAVEWLALYIKGISSLNHNEIIEQAKEMEKQQIIDAYSEGDVNGIMDAEVKAEQYYNKTFNDDNIQH